MHAPRMSAAPATKPHHAASAQPGTSHTPAADTAGTVSFDAGVAPALICTAPSPPDIDHLRSNLRVASLCPAMRVPASMPCVVPGSQHAVHSPSSDDDEARV